MKKLYIIGLISLLSTACSTDDISTANEQDVAAAMTQSEAAADTCYLVARLVAPAAEATTSRADTDDDATFDEGALNENSIYRAMFFFFDDNGDPVPVRWRVTGMTEKVNYSYVSTIMTDAASSEQSEDGSVSYIASVVVPIVRLTNEAQKFPTKVVAWINCDDVTTWEMKDQSYADLTLDKLRNMTVALNRQTIDTWQQMSNSVYLNSSGQEECAASMSEDNVCSTAAEAAKHPVTIYVEHMSAKVSVAVKNDGIYKLKDQPYYVKITGWSTFDEANSTTLTKSLGDPDIYNQFTWNWNSPEKHRSYWAYSPWELTDETGERQLTNQTTAYENISKNVSGTTNSGNVYMYLFENAGGDFPTKYILKGTLYEDADCSKKATICRYLSSSYTLTELKQLIADILGKHFFYKSGGTMYPIPYTKISFQQQKYYAKPILNWTNRYYYYYDAESEKYVLYTQAKFKEDVAKYVDVLPMARIWNNGMCYYYGNIPHLNGENAVVRNHWYQITIDEISGLGTPVYSKYGYFDPTRPTEEDWELEASVKVQAWRIVPSQLDFASDKTEQDYSEELATTQGDTN